MLIWSGSVSAVPITVSQFEQWAAIMFFCKRWKSAVETDTSLSVIYRDKALKL